MRHGKEQRGKSPARPEMEGQAGPGPFPLERRRAVEHDADVRPAGEQVSARGYVEEATKGFFGDSRPVTPGELRQAAAGFVVLVLLGGLLISRVL